MGDLDLSIVCLLKAHILNGVTRWDVTLCVYVTVFPCSSARKMPFGPLLLVDNVERKAVMLEIPAKR